MGLKLSLFWYSFQVQAYDIDIWYRTMNMGMHANWNIRKCLTWSSVVFDGIIIHFRCTYPLYESLRYLCSTHWYKNCVCISTKWKDITILVNTVHCLCSRRFEACGGWGNLLTLLLSIYFVFSTQYFHIFIPRNKSKIDLHTLDAIWTILQALSESIDRETETLRVNRPSRVNCIFPSETLPGTKNT